MTLYDELVQLFREHRLKVAPAKCECGTQFDRKFTFAELLAMHREHLAALACERAHNDFELTPNVPIPSVPTRKPMTSAEGRAMTERFDLEKWLAGVEPPIDGSSRFVIHKAVEAAENHQRELMEAELERVRKLERKAALEQAIGAVKQQQMVYLSIDKEGKPIGQGMTSLAAIIHTLESLIPAEDQGGPKVGTDAK